ncbi:hypothetical protein VWZ82_13010 [Phaeobacter sp. JH20_41]|uniref:hypothetical protein n=1 Tax=Phaeobacter sp. JH20_41 TaxID=3112498 RepID=UPI003A8AFBC5
MAKTRREVVNMALHHIGVVSSDEEPEAVDQLYADQVLDGVFAELQNSQDITISWGLDETPETAFLPLAFLLASEVAAHFGVQAMPRSRAMGRFRAALISDDRDDRRDLDNDNLVSDGEIEADKRAQYF